MNSDTPRQSRDQISKLPAILGSGRILQTSDVMALLGYRDSTTFWQAIRRNGLPFVRVSAKRAVFRERDVEAWMSARTVGAHARMTEGGVVI